LVVSICGKVFPPPVFFPRTWVTLRPRRVPTFFSWSRVMRLCRPECTVASVFFSHFFFPRPSFVRRLASPCCYPFPRVNFQNPIFYPFLSCLPVCFPALLHNPTHAPTNYVCVLNFTSFSFCYGEFFRAKIPRRLCPSSLPKLWSLPILPKVCVFLPLYLLSTRGRTLPLPSRIYSGAVFLPNSGQSDFPTNGVPNCPRKQ